MNSVAQIYADVRHRLEAASRALETEPTHRDDAAIWLFSGGTTGRPKAVVQTHRSYANSTECYGKGVLGLTEDDVTISVPKLFFGYAMGTNLFFPFSVGASCVLFPERCTPEAILERVERFRPTVLVNVPTMVQQMLADETLAERDLSSLRIATSAGEALPRELHERWNRAVGVDLSFAPVVDLDPAGLVQPVDGEVVTVLDVQPARRSRTGQRQRRAARRTAAPSPAGGAPVRVLGGLGVACRAAVAQPQDVELQLVERQRTGVELRGDRVAALLNVLRSAALALQVREAPDALLGARMGDHRPSSSSTTRSASVSETRRPIIGRSTDFSAPSRQERYMVRHMIPQRREPSICQNRTRESSTGRPPAAA